jgi:hypothetical protein
MTCNEPSINEPSDEKEKLATLEKNPMRKLYTTMNPILKQVIGKYYFVAHIIIIFLGSTVILFSNNIYYLLIAINMVFMDTVAILSFHECPLTILEQKYINTNICNESKTSLNKLNIQHNCMHIYESQVELMVNLWTLLCIKILGLIVMKIFSIQNNT